MISVNVKYHIDQARFCVLEEYAFPPNQSDSKGTAQVTQSSERAVVAENRNCNKGETPCMCHSIFATC